MVLKESFSKVAEVELIYKNRVKASERVQITSSLDAYEILINNWDKGKLELQEQFKIVLLDRKNSVLGISTIAWGGISECAVDLRLAFATALKARATAMILAHNHPSGNTAFSDSDKSMTRKFAEAGKVLDISILDHIVVTNDGYSSMSDNGYMPAVHFKL
ncbi:JAB domain-containing protein [Flavobacterium sp. TBRC 19031]|uniref:JAB domain-containing protein n=1 Tax=Flavobacterium mekongense TaxID=3379707 RepID=UPI00399AD90F